MQLFRQTDIECLGGSRWFKATFTRHFVTEYRLISHRFAFVPRCRISGIGNRRFHSEEGDTPEYEDRGARMTLSRARALNEKTYALFGDLRATEAGGWYFWKWGSAARYVTRLVRTRVMKCFAVRLFAPLRSRPLPSPHAASAEFSTRLRWVWPRARRVVSLLKT